MYELPNIIGDRVVFPSDSEGAIPFHDLFTDEVLGYIPDISEMNLLRSIGVARKGYQDWNEMTISERLKKISEAGYAIDMTEEYDTVIARAEGNPVKFVTKGRKEVSNMMKYSRERAIQIFGEESIEKDEIKGKGVMVGIISTTVPETNAYVATDGWIGGCSVILKGDITDPVSSFLVAEKSRKYCPIVFLTYDRSKKPGFGHLLYTKADWMVMMGPPYLPKSVAYYNLIPEDIRKSKDLRLLINFLDKFPTPGKISSYVGHGAAAYAGETADPEVVAEVCVNSCTNGLRSCKRLTQLFINKKIEKETKARLKEKMENLKVGTVTDPSVDLPEVPQIYWDGYIDGYIRTATQTSGRILYGGKLNQATLIENPNESSWSLEVPYSVLGIKSVDGRDEGAACIRRMASMLPNGLLLEFILFSRDKEEMRMAKSLPTHNVHLNSPSYEFKKYHEGNALCLEVSRRRDLPY
jgi:acyl-CoA reductase-like NAD-dependent aldehyde dehydrogenase